MTVFVAEEELIVKDWRVIIMRKEFSSMPTRTYVTAWIRPVVAASFLVQNVDQRNVAMTAGIPDCVLSFRYLWINILKYVR